jgi:lipooligosaccharide transport system ATP-binding protein
MEEAERLCDRITIMDRRRVGDRAPRELIARHIEPQVVEVYGQGRAWVQRQGRSMACRVEQVETAFCYTPDGTLLDNLRTLRNCAYSTDLPTGTCFSSSPGASCAW